MQKAPGKCCGLAGKSALPDSGPLGGVLRTNHPLRSHPELEAAFEDLFDGREVVPSAFEDEYRRRLDEEPLAASLHRVPISIRQRHKLGRAGRLQGEIAPPAG